MNAEHRQRAHQIDAVTKPLSEWIAILHSERDPSLASRYGDDGQDLWRHETRVRLLHLAEAIAANRSELFVQNALWSRAAFLAREVDSGDLRRNLECTKEVCERELPTDVAPIASKFIGDALDALEHGPVDPLRAELTVSKPSEPSETNLARLYLLHLLQRNQSAAANIVFEASREGKSIPEIYELILTPALVEIGRMWHLQEATVADEHYCTAATQMIMAQLRARMPRKAPNGRRVLAMAVGGDLHDLGIRMVADLFEMEGWSTEYLGANMPTSEVLHALSDATSSGQPFDIIAVSANTTLSVRAVADLIEAIRSHPAAASIPVLVGGGPFRAVQDLWKVVGADGFAADASRALTLANSLVIHA